MGMIINPYLVQPSGDADAQAFFTAAGITDNTQKTAVNQLVVDLKADGLWSKMIAIYPFVGGTNTSHSYNLKNTSVGQLTYTAGITHGSLGIKSNTVAYANTGLKATTMGISQNSASVGVYIQGNWNPNQTMMYGTYGNFTLYKAGATAYYPAVNNSLSPSYTATTNNGFAQSSRTNSTQLLFKDKNDSVSTLSAGSSALNSSDFYICAANGYSGTDNYISLLYIGTGLTSGELDNYYTRVQAFQTTLGRQV